MIEAIPADVKVGYEAKILLEIIDILSGKSIESILFPGEDRCCFCLQECY